MTDSNKMEIKVASCDDCVFNCEGYDCVVFERIFDEEDNDIIRKGGFPEWCLLKQGNIVIMKE